MSVESNPERKEGKREVLKTVGRTLLLAAAINLSQSGGAYASLGHTKDSTKENMYGKKAVEDPLYQFSEEMVRYQEAAETLRSLGQEMASIASRLKEILADPNAFTDNEVNEVLIRAGEITERYHQETAIHDVLMTFGNYCEDDMRAFVFIQGEIKSQFDGMTNALESYFKTQQDQLSEKDIESLGF